VIGRRSANPAARALGLELSAGLPGVEHLADVDTAIDEFGPGCLDVGHDEIEAVGGPRCGLLTCRPSRPQPGHERQYAMTCEFALHNSALIEARVIAPPPSRKFLYAKRNDPLRWSGVKARDTRRGARAEPGNSARGRCL
jgi:hypothetical protein